VEFIMRSRFLLGVAAPALAALAFLSTAEPASAQYWYGSRGFGWGAAGLAAGIIGGALAVATAPLWASSYYGYRGYYPAYAYGPSVAYAPNFGYDYAPGYSYGPGYGYAANYGHGYGYGYAGYSPGFGYRGVYASAGRNVRVPARRAHHANHR
jgi:hypothetical protein